MADKTIFNDLFAINVNEHKEKKGGLDYLTWSWAWAEVKSRCPDATYKIKCNENGLPYFKEDGVGYMVMTEVTIEGETLMMWLPVMDYKNKAMLQPTMTDINKTIMRCLTKNLGMFGLGLYIYAGEDLPNDEAITREEKKEFELQECIKGIQKIKATIDRDAPNWWSDEVETRFVDGITEDNYMAIGKMCRDKALEIGKEKENE